MKNKRKTARGLVVVLSSPSGGGKTTVAQRLLRAEKDLVRSVSCTTRKPRPGERNGRDYFFVTVDRFKRMIAKREFLEWARVHRNLYGTPRAWVEGQLRQGKDVLFVIDVQGGHTLRRKVPGAVLIFLYPPSLRVLRERLVGRGTNDAKDLKVRLADARWEMRQGREYGHPIVNDRLPRTVREVRRVLREARKAAGAGT
ncbi:MAG TPA: guanylate kinase [bacterium]|nr:guanylate kinase [bacterium]